MQQAPTCCPGRFMPPIAADGAPPPPPMPPPALCGGLGILVGWYGSTCRSPASVMKAMPEWDTILARRQKAV